jgi:shikimate kinase
MKGKGRSVGAITAVNALFTGVGAAAAVSIPVESEVVLTERPPNDVARLKVDGPSDTPLVRASLAVALRSLAPKRSLDAEVRVHSMIPPARGLKSSSAVSNAVISGVASALGQRLAPEAVARLSADVAQSIGLSATGAFDDALAAAEGGCVVTDNRARLRLTDVPLDPQWRVVLWIPEATHRPSTEWATAFARHGPEGRSAADLALKGRLFEAMGRNTELVERVMGYGYRPLREELRRHGAVASGVSGMGPTLAVIAPPESVERILGVLPPDSSHRLTVGFTLAGQVGI